MPKFWVFRGFSQGKMTDSFLRKAVLSQKMNVGGVIICETPSDITLPDEAGEFTKRREYRYGRVVLNLYRHRTIED